ncbi:hypothetical protein [Azohydromonas caseinilytica]|uniref:PEP-CTERM protein-sorting domain-containing protein n=1 Tax=Azohydromonas caseinilytica TaxID=2728836 RepID=A0A848FCR0_9BURK|nr:hypothetical protein [Azohydromonas caseinilytica]NML17264.1 hypothetical protein [Azohydromonas caseinilytica]
MRLKFGSLVAAAVALAGNPSWADVLGSAQLSHFGYTLVDLNPHDGIAPALSFTPFGTQAASILSGRAYAGPSLGLGQYTQSGFTWSTSFAVFPEVRREVASEEAMVGGHMSGSVTDHTFTAGAQGRGSNTLASQTQASEFDVGALPVRRTDDSEGFPVLSVTPYTQVIWTGSVLLEVENTLGRRRNRFEQAFSQMSLELRDGANQVVDRFYAQVSTRKYQVDRVSQAWDLQTSFINNTAETQGGYMDLVLHTWGQSFRPAPIPEPGTPWLMLCGAGVLAATLRARKQSAVLISTSGAA